MVSHCSHQLPTAATLAPRFSKCNLIAPPEIRAAKKKVGWMDGGRGATRVDAARVRESHDQRTERARLLGENGWRESHECASRFDGRLQVLDAPRGFLIRFGKSRTQSSVPLLISIAVD